LKLLFLILLFITAASSGQVVTNHKFIAKEQIEPDILLGSIALKVDYEKSTIANFEYGKGINLDRIAKVYAVFSLYPTDTSKWLTPFSVLLRKRKAALKEVIGDFETKNIPIEIIMQTGCFDKDCAQKLFHGFLLKLKSNITNNDSISQFWQDVHKLDNPPEVSIGSLQPDFVSTVYDCGDNAGLTNDVIQFMGRNYFANTELGVLVEHISDSAITSINYNIGLGEGVTKKFYIHKNELYALSECKLYRLDILKGIWKKMKTNIPEYETNACLVNEAFSDGNFHWIYTNWGKGLWRSADGINWEKVEVKYFDSKLNGSKINTMGNGKFFSSKGFLWVSSGNSLFRTSNSGKTWAVAPTSSKNSTKMVSSFEIKDSIIVHYGKLEDSGFLHYSLNLGKSWSEAKIPDEIVEFSNLVG
jgi:hypothetical protein